MVFDDVACESDCERVEGDKERRVVRPVDRPAAMRLRWEGKGAQDSA